MMEKKENVTLIELKKLEEQSEKLGREIRMLSRAFKKMANTGLKEETIVLLLHASSNVSKTNIRAVIYAFKNLDKNYLKVEE